MEIAMLSTGSLFLLLQAAVVHSCLSTASVTTSSSGSCECDGTPFSVADGVTPVTQATQNGCSYTCPDGLTLAVPIIAMDTYAMVQAATCSGTSYTTTPVLIVGPFQQIGCSGACDLEDGPYDEAPSVTKPTINSCVLTCPVGTTVYCQVDTVNINMGVSTLLRAIDSTDTATWFALNQQSCPGVPNCK